MFSAGRREGVILQQAEANLGLPAFQVDWWDVRQHMLSGVQAVAVARVALDDGHGQVVAAAAEALAALAGCSPCEELLLEACRPAAALGECCAMLPGAAWCCDGPPIMPVLSPTYAHATAEAQLLAVLLLALWRLLRYWWLFTGGFTDGMYMSCSCSKELNGCCLA